MDVRAYQALAEAEEESKNSTEGEKAKHDKRNETAAQNC